MKANNSLLSFIALVLLLYYFGLPILGAVLINYFGSISTVIELLIDTIPFGNGLYSLVVHTISSISTNTFDFAQLKDSFLSVKDVAQELCKAVLVVIIFESLNSIVFRFTGLKTAYGHWNKAKKAVLTFSDAVFAACLSPIPLEFCFSQLDSLSETAEAVWTSIISVIMVGGGTAFFAVIGAVSVITAFALIGVGIFLAGFVQITFSYFFLFLILISIENGNYLLTFCGLSGLLVTGIVIALVSILLE